MATKIRLQRGGRKGYAFYRIVIADSRAPRDGKFTEKIGTYNPNTNPATVDLNFERAPYRVDSCRGLINSQNEKTRSVKRSKNINPRNNSSWDLLFYQALAFTI